jgi:molecular chaperone DnaJ
VPAVKADYYEVLGIPRDADEDAVRRAFHTLARDCHPDVSDAPEDHQRFRELAEAYGVLSKPASRLLYDRYGYRGRGNHAYPEEVEAGEEPGERGDDVRAAIELEAYEATRGARKLVRYEAVSECPSCEGVGVLGEPDPECAECGGTGQVREVSEVAAAHILRIELCVACGLLQCDECDGTGLVVAERVVRVRVPPGIEDGDQLRVAGEGGVGDPDAPAGDLLLDLAVKPEPRDPGLVRYLALAGMLAAVALLVAYVLLS